MSLARAYYRMENEKRQQNAMLKKLKRITITMQFYNVIYVWKYFNVASCTVNSGDWSNFVKYNDAWSVICVALWTVSPVCPSTWYAHSEIRVPLMQNLQSTNQPIERSEPVIPALSSADLRYSRQDLFEQSNLQGIMCTGNISRCFNSTRRKIPLKDDTWRFFLRDTHKVNLQTALKLFPSGHTPTVKGKMSR